jgi:orotidine-5'-phosphate decarboxylase
MTNIHCLGGVKMMKAAAEAAAYFTPSTRPLIIGVTILTSMTSDDLREVGIDVGSHDPLDTTSNPMVRLAKLAKQSGLDGVVCSGQEASVIRGATDESFVLVTPGIRLPDGNKDDQARIVTPEMAIESGATHLVIGRPITGASDPLAALQDFNNRVNSATTTKE